MHECNRAVRSLPNQDVEALATFGPKPTFAQDRAEVCFETKADLLDHPCKLRFSCASDAMRPAFASHAGRLNLFFKFNASATKLSRQVSKFWQAIGNWQRFVTVVDV